MKIGNTNHFTLLQIALHVQTTRDKLWTGMECRIKISLGGHQTPPNICTHTLKNRIDSKRHQRWKSALLQRPFCFQRGDVLAQHAVWFNKQEGDWLTHEALLFHFVHFALFIVRMNFNRNKKKTKHLPPICFYFLVEIENAIKSVEQCKKWLWATSLLHHQNRAFLTPRRLRSREAATCNLLRAILKHVSCE